MSEKSYSPGLEGVIAGVTAISNIDTERNVLTYRGYDIADLVANATFEEVAYLILYGDLPNAPQLAEFNDWLVYERNVPDAAYDALRLLPRAAEPMHWLKTLVAILAHFEPQQGIHTHDANFGKAVRLIAKMPMLVANGWRVVNGQAPTPCCDARLGHTAQFLYLLQGEQPDELHARVLNTTLILYAEHGFNASTFTARVTVSTLSDLYSGVVSAIGALKGPLHGGANEEVMRMLLEIGTPDRVEEWAGRRLTKSPENPHPRIMGFGHREYRVCDQRAQIMKGWLRELAQREGQTLWLEIAERLEEYMLRERGLFPNLDFPVSPSYYIMGLPIPIYTPLFVMARIVGWSAHIIEQLDHNRLIRPTSLYNGPGPRAYAPLDQRG